MTHTQTRHDMADAILIGWLLRVGAPPAIAREIRRWIPAHASRDWAEALAGAVEWRVNAITEALRHFMGTHPAAVSDLEQHLRDLADPPHAEPPPEEEEASGRATATENPSCGASPVPLGDGWLAAALVLRDEVESLLFCLGVAVLQTGDSDIATWERLALDHAGALDVAAEGLLQHLQTQPVPAKPPLRLVIAAKHAATTVWWLTLASHGAAAQREKGHAT